MSFDLKILLAKGFEPPVPVVELRPLKRDRDRSEEEHQAWEQQQHERARQKARDAAWAPFSKNLPMRNMALVNEVLRRAGVQQQQLQSNDGLLITPAECTFIAGRLKTWLDEGGAVFQFREFEWDLTPAAKDKNDRANRQFLFDIAAFFARAAEHRGIEVW